MADCEFVSTCIFFNDKMANMPSTAEVFKAMYCRKDSSKCARMIVVKAIGRENVPKDLFPNQSAMAEEVISRFK